MPVFILVRQVLVICRDFRIARFANVCEQILVALLTVRLVISQYVALTVQTGRTLPAAELTAAPVLLQRLRKVVGKQQLVLLQTGRSFSLSSVVDLQRIGVVDAGARVRGKGGAERPVVVVTRSVMVVASVIVSGGQERL